jgi:hypothetical protein
LSYPNVLSELKPSNASEPTYWELADLANLSVERVVNLAAFIWVMDHGMVSKANIDFLRHRKALQIVGTPKSELRHFEAELAEEENWNVVQQGREARLVAHMPFAFSSRPVLSVI